MLTSRRDYLLRIIDEVSRLLARVIFKHRAGDDREALQTVVQACERLFGMEADKLFQFTPEQHYLMLTADGPEEPSRDKVLVYAALNTEAGKIYASRGNHAMARASFLNALRLSARARLEMGNNALPEFTPDISFLQAQVTDAPLDEDTRALLERLRAASPPSG